MLRAALLSVVCAASFPAWADEDTWPLKGSAYLMREYCEGGAKTEGCVLAFEIDGPLAEMLYKNMRVKPVKDECIEGTRKDDGDGLRCFKYPDGKISCDFGYDFSKRKLTDSKIPC